VGQHRGAVAVGAVLRALPFVNRLLDAVLREDPTAAVVTRPLASVTVAVSRSAARNRTTGAYCTRALWPALSSAAEDDDQAKRYGAVPPVAVASPVTVLPSPETLIWTAGESDGTAGTSLPPSRLPSSTTPAGWQM
jgi:hypothetical protein